MFELESLFSSGATLSADLDVSQLAGEMDELQEASAALDMTLNSLSVATATNEALQSALTLMATTTQESMSADLKNLIIANVASASGGQLVINLDDVATVESVAEVLKNAAANAAMIIEKLLNAVKRLVGTIIRVAAIREKQANKLATDLAGKEATKFKVEAKGTFSIFTESTEGKGVANIEAILGGRGGVASLDALVTAAKDGSKGGAKPNFADLVKAGTEGLVAKDVTVAGRAFTVYSAFPSTTGIRVSVVEGKESVGFTRGAGSKDTLEFTGADAIKAAKKAALMYSQLKGLKMSAAAPKGDELKAFSDDAGKSNVVQAIRFVVSMFKAHVDYSYALAAGYYAIANKATGKAEVKDPAAKEEPTKTE